MSGVTVDRTRAPQPGPAPRLGLPEVWTHGGEGTPRLVGCVVPGLAYGVLSVGVPAGFRLGSPRRDGSDGPAGSAALIAELLSEGTDRVDGTALQDELDGYGATLDVRADDDEIVVEVVALERFLEPAARLLVEVITRPRFEAADVERLKRQRIARLEARAADAAHLAADAWRARIFGAGTRAGRPPGGTPESVAALERDDLLHAWRSAQDPARLRVALVGPLDPGRAAGLLAPLAEAGPTVRAPEPDDDAALGAGRRLTLVDRPGAPQTHLRVGHLGPAANDPDFYALHALNHPLGGAFSSRLNLNLREDKGWTYGVRSGFVGGLGRGWFQVGAAVQTDVTADAAREIVGELERFRADGVTAEEVEFARLSLSQTLLRQYESAGAKAALVANVGKFGWPPDYPARRLEWLGSMDAGVLDELADRHLRLDRLEVLAVGDAERIRGPLEDLGLGEFELR